MFCSILTTIHFKRKKLVTNSPRKSEHVLDTINQNWFCPWGLFCCRSSYLHIKPTRGHWAWANYIESKNRRHFSIPTFWDLQLCILVLGWFEHFKGPKNASCLWFKCKQMLSIPIWPKFGPLGQKKGKNRQKNSQIWKQPKKFACRWIFYFLLRINYLLCKWLKSEIKTYVFWFEDQGGPKSPKIKVEFFLKKKSVFSCRRQSRRQI